MAELVIGAVISALVGTAVSYVAGRILAPKAKQEQRLGTNAAPQSSDILGVAPNPGGPQIGVFGHRRVGGRTIVHEKRANKTYIVVAIAGAPVHSINAVFINNELASIDGSGDVLSTPWANGSTSSMNIELYDGTQIAVDAVLLAAFPNWTADHIGFETTYARIVIDPTPVVVPPFSEVYQKGVPDFTFDVCGFKCYDPREGGHDIDDPGTWEFSKNAAIINANYLIHPLGHALPMTRVDWPSVEVAADICDDVVELKDGGQEVRYECAVYWLTDERHESVLERIGASHGGGMYFVGSKYRARTGAWTAPSASYGPGHYEAEGLSFAETPALENIANGVRGTFTSPLHNYEERDFPDHQDGDALGEDGSEFWLDLNLQCVTSHTQAQRLARIAYNKARFGFSASLALQFSAFDTIAEDTIELTDPLADFEGKTFRVGRDECTENYVVNLALEHERSDFYDWDETTDEQDFNAFDAIGGEGGTLQPPGGFLVDNPAGGGSICAPLVILLPSPNENCDQIRRVATYVGGSNTGSDFTFDLPAALTSIAMFGVASSPVGGNLTVATLQMKSSATGAVSAPVSFIPGSVALSAINGLVEATTPYWVLPVPRAPRIKSLFSGASILEMKAVLGSKSDELEFWTNTVPDFGAATLITTEPNADFEEQVSGSPGEAKFYWARTKHITGPVFSLPSNPTLVVF